MNKTTFFLVLIVTFSFLRYLRANKQVTHLAITLFFIGLAIYESKNNSLMIMILLIIIPVFGYFSVLKEKRHPFILKLQKGYKPSEIFMHIIIFFIIGFLLLIVFYI